MNNFRINKLPYSEQSQTTLMQIFYYFCIGISLNSASYLLYLLATSCQISPKISMSVLYVCGVTLSILANRKWTFYHKGALSSVLIRAALAYLFGYLIDLGMLHWLVDIYGYPHQLIQFIAIGCVAIFLFLTLKFFVFKRSAQDEGYE